MLLPIKPICERIKVRKDGTSLVFIQYCLSASNKTLLNTEIAIPPQYWHKKLNRVNDSLPKEYGNVEVLNKEIQRQIRLAEDIISYALEHSIENPAKFVKALFYPKFDITSLDKTAANKAKEIVTPKNNLDFFFQFDDYIQSKEKDVAPSTLSVFKNLKFVLERFQEFRKKKITFESIDINFYDEFRTYLTYEHIHQNKLEQIKGFKTNTVGKNIKQLIIFLKNRKAKKIIASLDLDGFKIPEEEADAIYLTTDEIKLILNLDLTEKKHLIKYRDLFVFGCLTGLRFSDFSAIQANDVRDGMLYKCKIR